MINKFHFCKLSLIFPYVPPLTWRKHTHMLITVLRLTTSTYHCLSRMCIKLSGLSVKNSGKQRGWCKKPNRKARSGGKAKIWRIAWREKLTFEQLRHSNYQILQNLTMQQVTFRLQTNASKPAPRQNRAHDFLNSNQKNPLSLTRGGRWTPNWTLSSRLTNFEIWKSWVRGTSGPRTRPCFAATVDVFLPSSDFCFSKRYIQ